MPGRQALQPEALSPPRYHGFAMMQAVTLNTLQRQPQKQPLDRAVVFIWLIAALLALGGVVGIAGCASVPLAGERPALEVVLDPEARTAERVSAVDRVPDVRVFELFELVTYSRHPMAVRRAAVDRMLTQDGARFWAAAAGQVASIDDWPMIRLLSERAGRRGDTDALGWLVMSWSVPSTTVDDTGRPESDAIKAITGDEGLAYLRDLFAEPAAGTPVYVRAAAWTVLVRVDGEASEKLIARALDYRHRHAPDAQDPLLDALSLCVGVVEVYPAGPEGLLRLNALVEQTPTEVWDDWAQWSGRPRDDRWATTALRHLPALSHRDRDHDAQRVQWWRQRVSETLGTRLRVYRGPRDPGQIVTARPEFIDAYAEQLGVADYLVMNQLLEAFSDRELVAELFRQAETDRRDTTSEHGGVLTWGPQGGLVAQSYPPTLREHDQVFYASDACVRAMHTGLAHYHFHAQEYDNAAWAGPGAGDLGFADRMQANCVVLTYIDPDTLNVDVYFPGGAVVDLGCIRR